MNCRHCDAPLRQTFLDLGHAPPSNAYLDRASLTKPEIYYPLKLKVCEQCWLVQTEDYASAHELFCADYAYFSSVSESWLAHAARYAQAITAQIGLNSESLVIEIASNDGYLLKNFVDAGIPCLGIEPTASTAAAAEAIGVPTIREFFSNTLARTLVERGQAADLILGNNVYAHVPDINDFTAGLRTLLKPGGTITLEFPHLMRLIEQVQFDTVYHEHFSYLSLTTVGQIFAVAGLRVCGVEELSTHGGSLRVYGCHAGDRRADSHSVAAILAAEQTRGLGDLALYEAFQARAERVKDRLVSFLIDQKAARRSVVGYGAAAKGNTLLNYGGIKPDLLRIVCDAGPAKQGKFLPGSHIPVLAPSALREIKPNFVLIFPWNIAEEICQQHSYIRDWGGKFVVAVPEIRELT